MSDAIKGGRKASLSTPGVSLAALAIVLLLVACAAAPAGATPPLAGYNPARLSEQRSGAFLDSAGFAADTVLPAYSIIDDSWDGPFTPRDHNSADLYWKAAAGVTRSRWRVAAFNCGELFVDGNRDAIEFIYAVKKKKDLETGRTYQVDIEAHGFIANGVEISHGRSLDNLVPGLSAGVTLRYLNGNYLQDGKMTGYVIPLGPQSYDFDLYLDYYYSENWIYRRSGEYTGNGHGFSADLGLSWRYGGFTAEALLRDLGGNIYWDSVSYTTAYAETAGPPTTTNGYQEFEPSIRGYEGNKSHRQRIPLKTDLTVGYRHDSFSVTGTLILIDSSPRSWVEAGYHPSEEWNVTFGYNFDYNAFNCGIAAYGLTFGATLEDPSWQDSKALGVQLAYLYQW